MSSECWHKPSNRVRQAGLASEPRVNERLDAISDGPAVRTWVYLAMIAPRGIVAIFASLLAVLACRDAPPARPSLETATRGFSVADSLRYLDPKEQCGYHYPADRFLRARPGAVDRLHEFTAADPDGNLFRVFYDFTTPERERLRAADP